MDSLVDLDTSGVIILKTFLINTACDRVGLESIDLEWSSVVGIFECGDEQQLYIH